MAEPAIVENLKKRFGSAGEDAPSGSVVLEAQDIEKAVLFLTEEHAFDFLMNLAAIDYKDRLAVVYNLYSFKTGKKISLKIFVAKDNPSVPSISRILPAADWHEREAYDLMGISFSAHPDLRRILLPDDWEGHPLRKDYIKEGIVKMPRV